MPFRGPRFACFLLVYIINPWADSTRAATHPLGPLRSEHVTLQSQSMHTTKSPVFPILSPPNPTPCFDREDAQKKRHA